jgi:regulator of protease activity HflC (stomatin/prohibitin superfamily)
VGALIVIVIVLVVALLFLSASVKVAREYERGVVFRLGRLIGLKGPGLFILVPFTTRP